MSVARARVTKLEASAVGETDPTSTHLQEASKKAKAQCQVRPVEDRIASSKEFIEEDCCVSSRSQSAQEALGKAQSELQQEEQGLTDGEARLAILMQESAEVGPRVEEVPPTMPANFAQELVELRACLRVAATKLGFAFAVIVWSEWRRTRTQTAQKFGKFHSRFGTVEPGSHRCRFGCWSEHATDDSRCTSVRMETLIDNAEESLLCSNRINPLSG